ncbi:SpaA isopeptide-forming pilin-related protein [Gemmiger sp.]|uniref:SpaA isopeptide-forming pilin-related protein n=1 Tax=Gemmiger sp. TaxID=2049027 RepID=UPI0025B82DC4|nr:SpaA isopeptide-forming pilin-related protein [Gemmiger sp.]
MNRTGNNTTGWARRLTALLVTACLVMAMALPVYAEVDLLPDAPDEVELLEDKPGTASGEDTALPEQNAATPVPEAATPEPEQSAEPEQPAPTETPEPTAEPTLTPEPTATATATPVPTVTPTATPEPTEQPQKMYAAKSVDNVQAVSATGVPATYKLYFAVPSSWSDCTRVIIYAVATNDTTKDPYTLEMQEDGKTGDGRKIYSADLNKDKHYPYGGLNGLEFHGYKGDTLEDSVVIADVNTRTWWRTFDPTRDDYIGGNYYDAEGAEGEKWSTYTVTVRHNQFAGKEMSFENKTGEKLTNVQAWFYEPNDKGELIQVGGPIPSNSAGADSGIAPNSTATFTIPNELCSYVKFTWGEDNPQQSSKYYNFYGEDVSGDDKKSFTYNSDTRNCFIYTGVDNERWGIENSVLIYYDATFSKLPTTGKDDTGGDYSIPKDKQSTVYYRLKGENDNESINGTMSRIGSTDYYAADVPDGYTEIVFSSYPLSDDKNLANCGNSTGWETIPTDYKVTERCFYADTNDDAVYGKGQRGGYWAPKGTPRDAEKGKDTGTKVVDIKPADFTEKADTKYVTSTLYDYYTDYELNGKNRGSYDQSSPAVSYRNWVPFREFDQALSDYYQAADAKYPLYTGHFQPSYSDWGYRFDAISAALNLWGLNNDFKDENRFMAINNSTINEEGKGTRYDYAYQGLVADTTSTGKATGEPLLKGTTKAEPHFDEAFLSGTNTKNAKLGNVYNNVAFPFTKKAIFDEDQGVDYWYFDSQDTTLYLKQDTEQDQYFLKSSTDEQEREKSRNLESNSTSKTITKNDKTVSSYGYFPFNETATSGVASTYNYGFGTKLQMDFTLTDDGMVETNKTGEDGKKEKTSIKFFFSGDDDVWVFIDGKLALDVGGAHGKVSGLLEFGETNTKDGKKNSVTAYVSRVKTGGTSDKDKDEKNDKPVKTVTYNGEKISFYKESIPLVAKDTPLVLDKGKKHTLTMYYMERGMWESNMAVAFNFPDNNELQVQKEVDLTNVTDDDFKNCFKNQKIFNFTIQNQATHYGTTLAAIPNPSDTKKVNLTAEGNTIEPATPGKKDDYIFELVKNPWPDSKPDSGQDPGQDTGQNTEQVLHWYARYMDTQSAAREKRRGILKLENPINIKDMRFLTFQVYVDTTDGSEGDLSLNNLYVELLDDKDVQKGSLDTSGINGATYGSVEVTTDQWVTVKLDLHKMKERDGFSDNVKTIRVGDNYNRNIYFRNFTFIPKAVPSKVTGFTTDQEKIPDYGSAESGHLENAENAQYTSSNDTDTQLVDKDGRFVLEAGETVTFSDQFRRGSYISLKEELNQNLYDTTWTVCENGHVVESMKEGNSVTLPSTIPSLDGQTGSSPNDGRTEKKGADKEQEGNKYNENKPSADTIVFRSYKDPDETSSTLTKLKVKYVNTVKTGGLKIQKQAAEGETLTGTYTFKVTFNDVGGEGLEEKPIERTVTIDMGKGESTGTITGIPVGTRYTIEEVKTDDSRLQSVTVPKGQSAQVIYNTMVEGEIVASKNPDNPNDPKDLEVTAIFTNTKRKLINIEFDKLWKDANNEDIVTTNQPDEIYIQLQRRLANSAEDAPWDVVDYPTSGSKYVTVHHTDNGWLYPFNNLDQYPVGGSAANNYIYRIVEGTVDEAGNFTAADGTITIDGKTYVVTAEATAKSETNSETGATTTPATATDGTITGGSGKIVLTNTLQNPKFALDIIKKDAELNNEGQEVFLKDVEFKLEKLVETTEGKTQWVVDKNYPFNSTNKGSITGITGADGKIIDNPFTDLEPGTYRLTETKAHPGYNLLAQPIEIKFTQGGECFIDGEKITDTKTFVQSGNIYTMTLTVLNRKTPELPHTGADAPSLWLLIGMPLAVAGLLIFTFRYNRKGGRRH